MPTCGDLISECSAQLHGYGSTQDRITPLTANIGPTDTTFTVDFTFGQAVGITPGVVEIDSEQLYVTSIDSSTGLATVANGFGRGYGGTTAASHTAGARVISRPKFPRIWLFKQVNEVLGAVFPDLFAVNTFTSTVTFPRNTYQLPVTPGVPIRVLSCQWQDPLGDWRDTYAFKIDRFDSTLRLGSGPMIGRPLRVQFTSEPNSFVAETDDFVATTGLPASCFDVIRLGVVAQVVPGLDISRAQLSSVEQSDRSRVVPPSAGVNAGKYIMAEYQNRLANEAQSLRRWYRPTTVKVW